MTHSRRDLMERVQRVVKETVLDDSLEITESTKLADIPEWDSMLHVTLVMALEREFGVRLSAKEADASIAIGPILAILASKLDRHRPQYS